MFLAIKEILHDKKKYSLVIGVMFLISYMVFFLISLAYGLAMENRIGIDQWNADQIILTEEADGTINRSTIKQENFDEIEADTVAPILQMPTNATSEDIGSDEKLSISLFGINFDDFIAPEVTEGNNVTADNEALIDDSLTEEYGLSIGDTFTINEQDFEVVGLTTDTKFSIAPMVISHKMPTEKHSRQQWIRQHKVKFLMVLKYQQTLPKPPMPLLYRVK